MFEPDSLLGPARDRAARGELAVHDHVCGMYETLLEQDEATCRFLKAGLLGNIITRERLMQSFLSGEDEPRHSPRTAISNSNG